ncbi:MAG TPA: hypothetical protein VEC14_02480, partial [Reyranellaceae bacterium]|nr:hypothetical protein [Reyranellaceae bacterium]
MIERRRRGLAVAGRLGALVIAAPALCMLVVAAREIVLAVAVATAAAPAAAATPAAPAIAVATILAAILAAAIAALTGALGCGLAVGLIARRAFVRRRFGRGAVLVARRFAIGEAGPVLALATAFLVAAAAPAAAPAAAAAAIAAILTLAAAIVGAFARLVGGGVIGLVGRRVAANVVARA